MLHIFSILVGVRPKPFSMVQCGFIERELSSHMVLDRRKKESQLLRRRRGGDDGGGMRNGAGAAAVLTP